MFYTLFEHSIGIRVGILVLVSLPKCDPWPLVCFAMDNALYASMDVVDCNMLYVCENVSMSVYSLDYDTMLHESLGVVNISNIKLLKKNVKKFHRNLSKSHCEKDNLIAKLNESNKLNQTYWLRNIKNLLKFLLKS